MFSWLKEGLGRKVGFRFLRAKKSSSFLSLTTFISVGGVAVGVLTLIVTLSVMSGFEGELKKRLFQADTHVLIQTKDLFFPKDEELKEIIKTSSDEITHVYPVLQTEMILRSGKKVTGGLLKGVGAEQLDWVKALVNEWSPDDFLNSVPKGERIFVGQEMALDLGVIAGDKVTVVSPVESDGPFGAIPRTKQFVVEGIYRSGVPEQEVHTVFVPMEGVEAFLKTDKVWSQIEVVTKKLESSTDVQKQIAQRVDANKYQVRSWQDLNAHLFRSLALERIAMFILLFFIVIVASFNIISTLTMMVIEKKKSLSVLRAIGANKNQIASIFLWEGLFIGVVGIGIGLVLSLSICYLLKMYPIIELPEFYYDRTLPIEIDPASILLIVLVAIAVVLLGAVMPSRKAAELTPLEGIRDST